MSKNNHGNSKKEAENNTGYKNQKVEQRQGQRSKSKENGGKDGVLDKEQVAQPIKIRNDDNDKIIGMYSLVQKINGLGKGKEGVVIEDEKDGKLVVLPKDSSKPWGPRKRVDFEILSFRAVGANLTGEVLIEGKKSQEMIEASGSNKVEDKKSKGHESKNSKIAVNAGIIKEKAKEEERKGKGRFGGLVRSIRKTLSRSLSSFTNTNARSPVLPDEEEKEEEEEEEEEKEEEQEQ